jgi:predicted alpha/beta hydrolase family esterase
MKSQLLNIGGGDSFSRHEDFLAYLRTVTLHDPYGVSKSGWRRMLATSLPDFEVFTLAMPNVENAKYEEWKIWFERHHEFLKDSVILLGHSLGGMFLAKYLIENTTHFRIDKLFLMAAPCGYYDDPQGNDCASFAFDPTSLTLLNAKIPDIQIWHSEDDFVVPYSHALEFKKHLPDAKLVTFKDRNHFLQESFPELVDEIKRVG